MDSNVIAYLSTLVLLAAIGAWMHVRLAAIKVESQRLDFDLDRLKFARDQQDFMEQQHKDMLAMRREHARAMGGGIPGAILGTPIGARRRGPGEDMDS